MFPLFCCSWMWIISSTTTSKLIHTPSISLCCTLSLSHTHYTWTPACYSWVLQIGSCAMPPSLLEYNSIPLSKLTGRDRCKLCPLNHIMVLVWWWKRGCLVASIIIFNRWKLTPCLDLEAGEVCSELRRVQSCAKCNDDGYGRKSHLRCSVGASSFTFPLFLFIAALLTDYKEWMFLFAALPVWIILIQ